MRTVADLCTFIDRDPKLAALRDQVSKRLSDDPGHDIAHALRVALWAQRLGDDLDPRCVIAAALCHDIVNVPKDSPKRAQASTMSANVARRLMADYDFGDDEIDEIADAIRDHSYSRGAVPTTGLGRALQDADRLEALGAIGIMRTLSTGVRMGAKYFHPSDPWATDRALDDHAYSLDHFFKKLLGLADTMCTSAGRAEATRRIRTMQLFLDGLSDELGAPHPSTIDDK
jgi:uncharacterized protein